MKDISFCIPTNRGQEHIGKTINSLNAQEAKGIDYEILVFSENEIVGDNVVWVKEDGQKGPIYGHNILAHQANAKYVSILSDDVNFAPSAVESIYSFMESDAIQSKKFKVGGFSTDNQPCNCPGQGQRIGSVMNIPINFPRFPMARFPVLSKETISKHLNGHVWHPEFRYHAPDIWLGMFMGLNGETYQEDLGARISPHTNHAKCFTWEIIDCNTVYCLYANWLGGQREYISAEHPSYNRSDISRNVVMSWT